MTTAKKRRAKKTGGVDLAAVETEIDPKRTAASDRLRLVQTITEEAITASGMEPGEFFGQAIVAARKERDFIEASRKEITDPMTKAKKAVDALFRPWREIYEAIDAAASARLADYNARTRTAQAQALAAVGQGSRDAAVLTAAHTTAPTPAGLVEKETFEIAVADLDAVPRQFLTLDAKLVRDYIEAKRRAGAPQETLTIPGLQITWGTRVQRVGGAA